MSETRFTPGPWETFAGRPTTVETGDDGVPEVTIDLDAEPTGWHVSRRFTDNQGRRCREFLASVEIGAGQAEAAANAALIAAAPSLYEACEAMLEAWFDYHDRHHLTQPVTGRSGNAADLAIAALALARGEQTEQSR